MLLVVVCSVGTWLWLSRPVISEATNIAPFVWSSLAMFSWTIGLDSFSLCTRSLVALAKFTGVFPKLPSR